MDNTITRGGRGGLVTLARLGLAVKGVVYLVVGGLAVWAALGLGGEITGSEGALQRIGQQPFGDVLLWAAGLGLVGYAIWRGAQALLDVDGEGSDGKGLAKRGAHLLSGLAHIGLAIFAIGLATGRGGGGGGGAPGDQLWSLPSGQILVGIAGLVLLGLGLGQLIASLQASFMHKLRLSEMTPAQRQWTENLGRLGSGARAVVFGIIGAFLVSAAVNADPGAAVGLEGALQAISGSPFGPWLLGLVALGLVAYGVFCFAEARFRDVRI